jgi:hypothetical protein
VIFCSGGDDHYAKPPGRFSHNLQTKHFLGSVTRLGEFSLSQRVVVYFGQCFENHRSIANFWATFYHGTIYVKIWGKYWLGDIFTNSSGHPVSGSNRRE